MRTGDSQSESSDASLFLSLPEDVFAVISRFLSPSDICNLSFCCKSFCDLVGSEKIWLAQCEVLKVLPLLEVVKWRIGISSYKALCKFLVQVMKPLIGIWVHQNPELGNVVYVMPGFLSVVGCRIIPQEVGPSGIQEGRIMWSPVFEIICGLDGSTGFFLHGRDREGSCLYPGFVMGIERSCNVLLLEVKPKRATTEVRLREKEDWFPFWKLSLSERRKLLDIVTSHVAIHEVKPSSGRLFPSSKDDDAEMLLERRSMLLKMQKFGGNWKHMKLEEEDELCDNLVQVDINEWWKLMDNDNDDDGDNQLEGTPKKNFIKRFKTLIRESSSKTPLSSENLQSFLSSGDRFGLSLKAVKTEISCYQGWPNMDDDRFALYKLPMKDTEEYAGLWGGTFGWPHGKCNEDKHSKALYLVMLSYEEDGDERLLIGTKILEGNDYVNRPNGSAVFVVNMDTPSQEPFPFNTEHFEHSYSGTGIADGYGFRYPGSKPGSLFVVSDDRLAFVWHETKDVITLERLNLEETLKKGLGLCVPPLPPTMNFTYLTRSYRNVFVSSD